MTKGIIFDLDNCIFDTYSMGEHTLNPVLKALSVSDFSTATKEEIRKALWTTSLEDIINQYSIPTDVAEKMIMAYRMLEVPKNQQCKTYGDEKCIAELTVKKYLVTSGHQHLQQSKIDRLGISSLFDEIIIDATDDQKTRRGKKLIFIEILKTNSWDASEVLVVGDNPLSELGAAKVLGITAIQTLRPGVEKWEGADYHIGSLCELHSLVQL